METSSLTNVLWYFCCTCNSKAKGCTLERERGLDIHERCFAGSVVMCICVHVFRLTKYSIGKRLGLRFLWTHNG